MRKLSAISGRLGIIILLIAVFSSIALGADDYYFKATHSHNDYLSPRPLLDALDAGMGSIEADVYYMEMPFVDDKGNQRVMKDLYVAHAWDEITGDSNFWNTRGNLKQLYLEPLYKIYTEKGGKIYNSPEETLLLHVDFKTDIDKTWNLLQRILKSYPGLFTTFNRDTKEVVQGPVTIYTNDEPENIPDEWTTFYSTADGRFGNIYDPAVWESEEYLETKHRMPIVSSNIAAYNEFVKFFDFLVPGEDIVSQYADEYPGLSMETLYQNLYPDGWKLAAQLVDDGKIKVSDYLIGQMEEADRLGKTYGHLMRFWGGPDREWFWDIQKGLTNVVILTDRQKDLRDYLVNQYKTIPPR